MRFALLEERGVLGKKVNWHQISLTKENRWAAFTKPDGRRGGRKRALFSPSKPKVPLTETRPHRPGFEKRRFPRSEPNRVKKENWNKGTERKRQTAGAMKVSF